MRAHVRVQYDPKGTYHDCETNAKFCDEESCGEYAPCLSPKLFNPTALDAEQWVLAAKSLGLQEICLTAQHEGGFVSVIMPHARGLCRSPTPRAASYQPPPPTPSTHTHTHTHTYIHPMRARARLQPRCRCCPQPSTLPACTHVCVRHSLSPAWPRNCSAYATDFVAE